MKTAFYFLVFFVIQLGLKSQTWQWAQIEAQADASCYDVCSDQFSNVYTSGAAFAPGVLGGSVIPVAATSTTFTGYITKRNSSGNLVWTNFFPNLYVASITTDQSGNVLAIGFYSATIVIGTQTITAPTGFSQLLLKFNSAGSLMWYKQIYQQQQGGFASLKTDQNNNVFIGGWSVSNTITVSQYNIITPPNLIYANILVKLDPNGNYLWHTMSNSYNLTLINDLDVDLNGNCVVTGKFFGQLSIGATTLVSAGSGDIFVAKYTASGSQAWAKRMGGIMGDFGNAVSTDASANIYLSGSFSGNNVPLGNSIFSAGTSDDAFLIKLDPSGNPIWSKQIGSSLTTEAGLNLAAHNNGVFALIDVAGYTISLGGNTYTLSQIGSDMAVCQFDASGNLLFADMIKLGTGCWHSLCLDESCGVYVSCTAFNPIITIGNSVLSHTAQGAALVARLDAHINSPILTVSGNFSACVGSSLTLLASGATNYTWSNGSNGNSITFPVNNNTFVIVTGVSASLTCPATVYKFITAVNPPTVTLNASNSLICAGKQVTLSAGGASSYTWNTGSQSYSIVVTPSVSSVYQVFVSSANCSSSGTIGVQTMPAPLLQLQGLPSSICAGDQLTITATGADTYSWNGFSSSPIMILSSANNTVLTVSGTNTTTGCLASLNALIQVNICTDLKSYQFSLGGLRCYPIPATDQLIIETTEARSLVIRNALGQLILNLETVDGEAAVIETGSLPNGIYFIEDKKTSEKIRFVKLN